MAEGINKFKGVTSETEMNPVPSDAGSEIDTKKIIRYGTKCQALWGIFAEYCDSSTIHGIKYLGEQKRPLLERLFWIFVFVLSIYTCTTLSLNIWNKWNNNPVIVSFAEKKTSAWEIPFPAVTICTERKYNKAEFDCQKVINNIKNNMTLSMQEESHLKALRQICDNNDLNYVSGITSKFTYMSAITAFMPKTFPCVDMSWRHEKIQNCSAVRSLLTEEGLCYSFNNFDLREIYRKNVVVDNFYLKNRRDDQYGGNAYSFVDKIEWNLDDGYRPDAINDTFPRRVLSNGVSDRLHLKLRDLYQNHTRCGDRAPGFKIVLHTPGDIPRVTEQYILIPFKQTVRILITPKVMKTSKSLRSYDPVRRPCYFQNERYLRYFKRYTESNCKLECLSNFTLNRCGCVKFSMPRTISTKVRVCGVDNIDCMNLAESELAAIDFNPTLHRNTQGFSIATSCNCLQDCFSISYKSESLGFTEYTAPQIDEEAEAEVSIYFKEPTFSTLQRSELYSTTDFLANCGGLLGLFMGVSALSIAELVYFCSVRLVNNLIMRRKKRIEMIRRRREEIKRGLEANVTHGILHY